ncbi:DNA-3-methyladenine glycosylase 2 family protein, partial [Pseudomonas chlororaphis]|nr:DNA-3-methyladenine glycosylase 2 family protein [Pseudomonas chlororaphis]
MLGFLRARAIDGLETVSGDCYSRSISLDGVHGWFSVSPGDSDA